MMPTETQIEREAELLRQCIASGQVSAAQIVAHESAMIQRALLAKITRDTGIKFVIEGEAG